MAKLIGFYSPKGGCGATFLCGAMWLAASESGKKALAADLSVGVGTLDFALGFQNDSVYGIGDAARCECDLRDALCVSERNGSACFVRGGCDETNLARATDILKNSAFDYVFADLSRESFRSDILQALDKLMLVTDCAQISVKLCESFCCENQYKNISVIINKIIPSYIENAVLLTADETVDGIGAAPIGLIPWDPEAVIAMSRGLDGGIEDGILKTALTNTFLRIDGAFVPAADINVVYDCFKLKRGRKNEHSINSPR